MTGALRLLLVVVVASGAAFLLTRYFSATPPTSINEVEWLTQEFALDQQQAGEIASLHAAYQPICADHCAAIMSTRQSIAEATNDSDRSRSESALRDLQDTCQESTRDHLAAVAAVMDSAQGQRYLDLIGPRLTDHEHAEPFGLK